MNARQEERPLQQQEDPQPPHIKEEKEDLWVTQEEEFFPGQEEADLSKFPLTVVSVKTEEHEDKPPESSQLHHSPSCPEEFGGTLLLKTSKKTVSCKICSMDLTWHRSSTLLREHLKRRHGSMDEGKNSRKKQACISDLVQREACKPQQAAALTDAILNMLLTDMRLLSMVEDEGFRLMIHVFNPGYTLPSRTHFTKLMERKYEQTFQAV
ncbi:uncharacterized protein LOC133545324 isoform X3 [Nerophis ophidion]|uniref:uncharacterized protein LOC133545324 isoform X3 n=1 Tax=Nerophis ophidion TaxID=159077 RepID=UPI002AE06405|nr:uncharacterized protein LOC133545324 isoform X3 [Nerophis ophidion]